MTSQCSVANGLGVVLASDSVVSFGTSGKFFPTVNKIFSLAGRQPVGIMISGAANCSTTGLPWERIIGTYRNAMGEDEVEHLRGYYDKFQEIHKECSTEEAQRVNINSIKSDLIEYFTEKVFLSLSKKERLRNEFRGEVEYFVPEVSHYFDSSIEQIINDYSEMATEEIPNFTIFEETGKVEDKINQDWHNMVTNISPGTGEINDAAKLFCERHNLQEYMNKIEKIFLHFLLRHGRETFWKSQTQIVIAGFGSNDFYPTVISFTSSCIVGEGSFKNHQGHWIRPRDLTDSGELKKEENAGILRSAIHEDWDEYMEVFSASAFMLPYAYQQEINTILDGISPYLSNLLTDTLPSIILEGVGEHQKSLLGMVESSLEEGINELDEVAEKDVIVGLGKILSNENVSKKLHKEISDCIYKFTNFNRRREYFRSSVSMLPMNEIANIARYLVSTESQIMKWTSNQNVVGGPIDVAQITKEDGFLWVDTKHSFDPSKNPRQMDINRLSSNFR